MEGVDISRAERGMPFVVDTACPSHGTGTYTTRWISRPQVTPTRWVHQVGRKLLRVEGAIGTPAMASESLPVRFRRERVIIDYRQTSTGVMYGFLEHSAFNVQWLPTSRRAGTPGYPPIWQASENITD